MVTENEGDPFLMKMDSVGPKLHQISQKKLCGVYNTYTIAPRCYIHCCEALCSCSERDSYECAEAYQKLKCRSARSAHSNNALELLLITVLGV
jgi:hypothetical protein